ncbi:MULTISPECIES: hypothetical protein [unclassified Kribbella]|uniref:hypothetical protein n=1 Tax=unclassified Kribbella TaxID=2644121 RepID=UPI003016053B
MPSGPFALPAARIVDWLSGLTVCRAEPAARAAAVVVVMTIRRVRLVSPPTSGPANAAYRPWAG